MAEGTVHVVDDDDAVRRSLSLLLRAAGHGVREHASGEALLAALAALAAQPPAADACAVIDIRMEGMDGLALQEHLARRPGPLIPVVVVTGHADVPLAVQAMRNGAVDFIEKPYLPGRMLAAVADAQAQARLWRQGRRGGPLAGDAQARLAAEAQARLAMEAQARLAPLTGREREVLAAMVAGKPNKVIARDLGLSPRTVEAHRAALMDRLQVKSLAEAIRLALAAGLEA